jgi:hypothetical protein
MNDHNAEFRAGARAGLMIATTVVRRLEGYRDDTALEYFTGYDAAVADIVAVAGDLPPKAAGVLTALAEAIVHQTLGNATFEDYADWTPFAAMTTAERDADRQILFDSESEKEHVKSPTSNVVQLFSEHGAHQGSRHE